VTYNFAISANGSYDLFDEIEECVIDSSINIETEYLEKILAGFSLIDRGIPTLYEHLVTHLKDRIEEMGPERVSRAGYYLSRATNVHAGGYGFYIEMEKHIKRSLHEGKVTAADLAKIVENLLPQNLGSKEFQKDLEDFILLTKFDSPT